MADILSDISQDPDITLHILGNYIGSAYSPQVDVTQTPTGHEVTITYDDATEGIIAKTFPVEDGDDYNLTQEDRQQIAGIVEGDLDQYISDMERVTEQAEDAERGRSVAESERVTAERGRQTAETARDSAEGTRTQAESQRAENERQRAAAESSRASAETARATAETQRNGAEQSRQTAEGARATAEQARANAETQRAENESQRASAETSRATAEATRAGEWATIKADAQAATAGAENVDATMTKSGSVATVTVTDRNGTAHTATLTDGVSPTASVQRVEGGAEITVTDASGTTTAMLYDATIAEGSVTDEMLAPDGIKPQTAQLFGNQLTGTMSGTIDTAADAYAAPPMALTVEGASTQDGTPTPDAPVPILSVVDPVVTFAGKNLLDAANPDAQFLCTCTYENGALTVTSTSAGGWCYVRYRSSAVEWMQGQSVTLSAIASGTSTPMFGIEFYRNDNSRITFATSNTAAITRTVPSGTSYIMFLFYARNTNAGAVGDTATYRNIQFELGSTATTYEPYEGHTVPLYDGTLRSLPDGTKDALNLAYLRPSTREGWAWYRPTLTKRCEETAIAKEAYYPGVYDDGVMFLNVLDANKSRARGYCSHLPIGPESGVVPETGAAWIGVNNKSVYMVHMLANLGGITYQQFVDEWWPSNPITLIYPLATPVTTQLDPIELPTLPAPTATVWCDGGSAQPTFVMSYVKDTNLVVQALEAAIADLATS